MRRLATLLVVAVLTGVVLGAGRGPAVAAESFGGQFLVASEQMPDPRFAGTVILMVEHDENGAIGLVVNRPLGELPLTEVLEEPAEPDTLPEASILVHYGGPVQPQQGFVVHGPDYAVESTSTVTDTVSVTSDPKALFDIAAGEGPAQSLFVIGYAGWGPGQLEGEIARDDWVVVPLDPELLFDGDGDAKWQRAMDLQVIDL